MSQNQDHFNQSAYLLATAFAENAGEAGAENTDSDAPRPVEEASSRELFYELVAIALGTLFNKTPMASSLFDRELVLTVLSHLPDDEQTRLVNATEQWIRAEQFVRILATEGSRYVLTRRALSVLTITTSEGAVGELLETAVRHYMQKGGSPKLRLGVRRLVGDILSLTS